MAGLVFATLHVLCIVLDLVRLGICNVIQPHCIKWLPLLAAWLHGRSLGLRTPGPTLPPGTLRLLPVSIFVQPAPGLMAATEPAKRQQVAVPGNPEPT